MANKRFSEDNSDFILNKKLLSNDEKTLKDFIEWMNTEGFHINEKVHITKRDVSSGWGMIATKDIEQNEILFTIPKKATLCSQNCMLKKLFEQSKEELKSSSGWVELLVPLLHEYTNPSSRWLPYFNMVPFFEHLYLPMFWKEEEIRKELTGTSLPSALRSDLYNITQDFNNIVLPFVHKHPTFFKKEEITLELYKRMVAFVMAYSFTEPVEGDEDSDVDEMPNIPMMVPLADILNHVSKHNAYLKFSSHNLEMLATMNIKAGTEVYNTYGQHRNQSLLHMYGYAENPDVAEHDTVDIEVVVLLEVLKADVETQSQVQFLQKKWNHLLKLKIIVEEDFITLGRASVHNPELLQEILSVLVMNDSDFGNMVENEGWRSDDENDDCFDIFNYNKIVNLPDRQKQIIEKFVKYHMKQYPSSLKDEEAKLLDLTSDKQTEGKKSFIEVYSCFLRTGQLRICNSLLMALYR